MKKMLQVVLSLLLAAAILYWLYRDFPFSEVTGTLQHGMRWGWMALSLFFGILPQVLRGWRWKMALQPMGEEARASHCVYAVFMSFAASLVIPRIGEISRCGTLKRTDHVSFTRALGTVVTERIIDSFLVLLILLVTFLSELPLFFRFFRSAGISAQSLSARFTPQGCIVTAICALLVIGLLVILGRKLALMHRFRETFARFWEGIASLRSVKHLPLYFLYTVLIWVGYFLHFYLAFYAFDFTSGLDVSAGLLSFCMITVAVLVPTPNGAGPWHFAVKVVLMLFGISATHAILFALIVHALQTALVVLLGIYGYAVLFLGRRKGKDIPSHSL